MLLFLLNGLGRCLAYMPECVARALCWTFGEFIYYCVPSRRRLILSNLSHAFPKEDLQALKRIARESSRRTVEMALFSLASPFFDKDRMLDHFSVIADLEELGLKKEDLSEPRVAVVPHFCEMESIAVLPILWEDCLAETGVIYRPFRNKDLEKHVKRRRQRFGLTLLSRKEGFSKAGEILRRNGCVAILFDQNAGHNGTLGTFMNRVASTSELAGLFVQKYKTKLLAVYTKRTGFWRAEVHVEPIVCKQDKDTVTLAANQWLEDKLRNDMNSRCSWLWMHGRWRTQDEPQVRFRLEMRKSMLPETLAFYNKEKLDPTYRLWVRLPNWLGDVVMAVPLLRALRKGRPDVELTLIGSQAALELLEQLGIAHNYIPLPRRGFGYFSKFFSLRNAFPDTHLLFTNSMRGDLEAFIVGAKQRFGMLRPGKKRPLLSHTWDMPASIDEKMLHQTRVWEQYLKHFGLKEALDLSPLSITADATIKSQRAIGIIAGTENSPEKRWPVARWNELLNAITHNYPDAHCYLFGTPRDTAITEQLMQGRDTNKVHNIAGKTNLIQFAQKIAACDVVICNDTGGMHLANMLGVPVIAIYGPTNPVRTGPIFDASKTMLQPKDCPDTGGVGIEKVSTDAVLQALHSHF